MSRGTYPGKALNDSENKQEINSEDRKAYFAHRSTMYAESQEGLKSFDRTIITLSAGAFGLSIAFVSKIVPEPQLIWLLISAWICFVTTLFITLGSYLYSAFLFLRHIKSCDEYYNDSTPVNRRKLEQLTERGSNFVKALSIFVFIILIVGVTLLIIFGAINISTKGSGNVVRQENAETSATQTSTQTQTQTTTTSTP